jgi:Rieske Fe-S protein
VVLHHIKADLLRRSLVHVDHTTPTLTRRAVVACACGAACVAALSACSSYGSGGAPAPAAPAPTPGAPGAAPSGPGRPGGSADALTSTADIPVGGGTVFADQQVVVTQPTAGEFKAFSSTCTHRGCTVGEVAGGTINCRCHGSRFAVADGSVVRGPATSPLAEKNIQVEGNSIVLA